MIYVAGPGHGGPGHGREHLPRGHLQRVVSRHLPGRRGDAAALQAVFLSGRHSEPRGAGDARARSTKVASSGILAGPCLRGRLRQSRPDRRVRGRRRRGRDRRRWPRPGTRTSSSTRSPTARCCRSCISTATRSPTRPSSARISDEELESLFLGYGYHPYFVEGADPAAVHQAMAATLETVIAEIRAIQADARANGPGRAPAVADDHPAHAQGVDRARRRRREEDRGILALAPGAARRDGHEAGARPAARGVDEELPAGGALRRGRDAHAGAGRAGAHRVAGAWAPIRTPTAALLLQDLKMPDFRDYAVEVPTARVGGGGGHAGPRRLPARRDEAQSRPAGTSGCSARTRPPPTGWARCSR